MHPAVPGRGARAVRRDGAPAPHYGAVLGGDVRTPAGPLGTGLQPCSRPPPRTGMSQKHQLQSVLKLCW